ncbi:MAG: hypothetical protein SGILL_006265, partial [Bacillariaceae sp.]
IRNFLYYYSAFAEDVETQRRGTVMIARVDSQMLDFFFLITPYERKELLACLKDAPLRKSAIHYYFGDNSPVLRMIKVLWGVVTAGTDERFRLQMYPCLNMETRYKMMTFGLPTDIPITNSGIIKLKTHLRWIKMRKAIDEEREKEPKGSTIGIQFPDIMDVLFERGGGRQSHLGNIEFCFILEAKLDAIETETTKLGKKICDEVIRS